MENKKTAIVTGSSRGIGKAIALKLATKGYQIVINNFVYEESVEEVIKEVEAAGGTGTFIRADVSKFEEAKALIDQTVEKFGRIDLLVNNAGITRDGLIMRMSEQDFDSVINVNLKGAFNCSRFAAPVMIKQRSGKMVNISSIVGVRGNAGQANYAASKAGIIGLTKSLARELGSRNITVNAIAPGFIETEMTAALPEKVVAEFLAQIPLKKLGKPEDIANTVAFLASDEADYISGQVIAIDGALA